MNGPYIPVYQLSATIVVATPQEAVFVAQELVDRYGGEVVIFRRTGERPDMLLVNVATVGERP